MMTSRTALPRRLRRVGAAVLLVAGIADAESLTDGPYVLHLPSGSEARWVCDGRVERRDIVDREIEAICGDVPAMRLDASTAPGADSLPAVARWAALSDIHGQAGLFRQLLAAQQIVDAAGDWAWGDGVLVITGDVFDRGPAQLEALWAIYRLATQASAAGGRVELLLGNHEMMVLAGDLRYLHPRYVDIAERLGRPYDQLFAADTELGAWLRRRATVLRLGDTLFLHGGLHPHLARGSKPLDLAAMNAEFRAGLGLTHAAMAATPQRQWLFGSDGPVWYRGYFVEQRATPAEIDALLARMQAARIVVGHTTQPHIVSMYGGRVIGIDAAMKDGIRGELLLSQDGELWRGLSDGRRVPLSLDAVAAEPDAG